MLFYGDVYVLTFAQVCGYANKHDYVQTMHSIKTKLGMNIINNCHRISKSFDQRKTYFFLSMYRKRFINTGPTGSLKVLVSVNLIFFIDVHKGVY